MDSDSYIVIFFKLNDKKRLKIKEYISESHVIVKALQS